MFTIASEVRLNDDENSSVVQHLMAMNRYHMLMLFSEQTPESIKGHEDKERLREVALEILKVKLEEETDEVLVENIYCTSCT